MLTKEESIKIKNTIHRYMQEDYIKYGECLSEIIDKFTEKHKREIQLGDIYLNGEGDFVKIISIGIGVDLDVGEKSHDCLTIERLRDSVQFSFEYNKKTGKYFRVYKEKDGCFSIKNSTIELSSIEMMKPDLSKRYKLVEITDD